GVLTQQTVSEGKIEMRRVILRIRLDRLRERLRCGFVLAVVQGLQAVGDKIGRLQQQKCGEYRPHTLIVVREMRRLLCCRAAIWARAAAPRVCRRRTTAGCPPTRPCWTFHPKASP